MPILFDKTLPVARQEHICKFETVVLTSQINVERSVFEEEFKRLFALEPKGEKSSDGKFTICEEDLEKNCLFSNPTLFTDLKLCSQPAAEILLHEFKVTMMWKKHERMYGKFDHIISRDLYL